MQLRDHEAKVGRVDAFKLDPRLIKIDPAYNIRDMKSERTRAHIEEIKVSLRDPKIGGIKKPIEVRMVGDDVFVTDGECRLTACHEVIAEGIDIASVVCIHEKAGTDGIERVLNFATSGQSERYTELEMAVWCRRADRAGATHEQIASAAGWKNKESVGRHLKLLELPENVKAHISADDISATEAAKLMKTLPAGTDPNEAAKIIAANKEENKRLGVGKKTQHKVTAKTLQRDRPKAEPKPPAETKAPAIVPFEPLTLKESELTHVASRTFSPEEIAGFETGAPVEGVQSISELQQKIEGLTAGEAEAHRRDQEFEAAAPKPSPQSNKADVLIFGFMSANAIELAGMRRKLTAETEQAAADGGDVHDQMLLLDLADNIGELHFGDDWWQARNNSELDQVA